MTFPCSCFVFFFSFQKLRGPEASLLALALFRQVTCRYKSPDAIIHPSGQVTLARCLDSVLDLLPVFTLLIYELTGDKETGRAS